MVKGLAKSETACTMIVQIKYVDASTFDELKVGYSPVTARILTDDAHCPASCIKA
jgi:hypothetical protein